MLAEEIGVWEKELDVVMSRVGGHFVEAKAQQRARGCVQGLVSEIKRKNG